MTRAQYSLTPATLIYMEIPNYVVAAVAHFVPCTSHHHCTGRLYPLGQVRMYKYISPSTYKCKAESGTLLLLRVHIHSGILNTIPTCCAIQHGWWVGGSRRRFRCIIRRKSLNTSGSQPATMSMTQFYSHPCKD